MGEKYYNDIRELIGNTPVLKLNQLASKEAVPIFAKLEFWNPGGSVKDRIGKAMIEDAEARGLLKPGFTILEATAGNTGLGIALAAINKGYRIIFIVPEKFSVEKQILMKALGAEIINTPRERGMLGAMEKARELRAELPNAVELGQFVNPANPQVHYETTGPEIYHALGGEIDFLVAGAGSGGTFTGALRYLKEKIPAIKGVLADPEGSTMGGGEEHCYNIEGIGNNFIPETMDMGLVDAVIKVSDEEAFATVKQLARKEGLIVGTSAAAAVAASLKLAEKLTEGRIVTILPDRGDRYFSKNLYE
ncbi:PLP-dependent cysteine synthase family protein [Sinanaerobacter chloroacetimidivorans]|uniref:Cysteine synthase n=1 Tax=Sinanaerobacter chloroacetimidivorans TaxID=2818044 RepID=A0A8J7W332_9FIRM|nr:cysteine synthase family protein [Sinanaerobacter chloroacetimidivorans]MBR0599481.1 cysteine synthase family protein [Sinanaerobacter chloroacetimidivorans]